MPHVTNVQATGATQATAQPIQQEQQAQPTQPQPAQSSTQDRPEDNIISRVANYKHPEPAVASKPTEQTIFDPSTFDKIDSVEEAKKYAQSAYQSFERGYQKKFQDLAELRKTLEMQISNKPNQTWTIDSVRNLMQEPSFIAAANDVLKMNQPQDEFSNLSEAEKAEIAEIKRNNQMLIQQQQNLLLKQEDEQLKIKFPNYNPSAVDTVTADLLANKIKNTREYIWKAVDYEPAVNRAYQLGRQDERKRLDENNQGASYSGNAVGQSLASPIKRAKGESGENFLRRLYSHAVSAKTS